MTTPTLDIGPRTKALTLDAVKFASDEPGVFTGIASAVGVKDRHGEVIEAGAFDANDLAQVFPLLWQHDTRNPIGVVKFAVAANGDLVVERGEINLETQAGREAYALLKQGAIKSMSIGFNIPPGAVKWDDDAQIVRILVVDLWEVSLVTFPANPGAVIQTVKDAADLAAAELKAGKVLSAANRTKLEAARDALQAVLDADTPPAKSIDTDAIGHTSDAAEWAEVKQAIQETAARLRGDSER